MWDWNYPVTLTPDDNDTQLVSFPDLPEVHTFGDNQEEALMHARDAMETILEVYVDHKRPIPVPSPANGRPTVRPEALTCAKLAVYQTMQESGIRKAELARRLSWHLPQVDRLLNLRHASRLDQIEAALAAMGRELEIRVH